MSKVKRMKTVTYYTGATCQPGSSLLQLLNTLLPEGIAENCLSIEMDKEKGMRGFGSIWTVRVTVEKGYPEEKYIKKTNLWGLSD